MVNFEVKAALSALCAALRLFSRKLSWTLCRISFQKIALQQLLRRRTGWVLAQTWWSEKKSQLKPTPQPQSPGDAPPHAAWRAVPAASSAHCGVELIVTETRVRPAAAMFLDSSTSMLASL